MNHRRVKILIAFITITCFFSYGENVTSPHESHAIGVNYWASHAGTRMWRNWDRDVVDEDFRQLSKHGIKYLRVFPLWPDFQPILKVYSSGGVVKYVASDDGLPLPLHGEGSAGMSTGQMDNFSELVRLADKHNLKLIVALITGWMSGELYVPPALKGMNIMTDPESLVWQQKFVKSFVCEFKDESAIVAWDYGNECNNLEFLHDHHQAYVWSSILTGAIKSEDSTRPLISGMHGLRAENNAVWRIIDQGENTDILTTHPYSLFTPYAGQDGINTIRTILHAAAETRLYADISGKPAFVEETGVLGPMTGGENEKAAFARTALFSNWAHDCGGTFWWCAYDQSQLEYSPYNYSSIEAELGLFKEDRNVKPVALEFKKFSNFIDDLPFKSLPEFNSEAVCILSEGQDTWSVAYTSFILAKQAGFDIQYQKAEGKLKDSPLYLLPSVKGMTTFYKEFWFDLLEKVDEGATLYISLDDAHLQSFVDPLGIEVLLNLKRRDPVIFSAELSSGKLDFETHSERKFIINPKQTTVLATEADENPLFLKSEYGKGMIYLLAFPLEQNLTTTTGAFDKGLPSYSNIYHEIAEPFIANRIIKKYAANIGVTEHNMSENEKTIVLINYSPEDISTGIAIKENWKINNCLYGSMPAGNTIAIKANDALVFTVRKD